MSLVTVIWPSGKVYALKGSVMPFDETRWRVMVGEKRAVLVPHDCLILVDDSASDGKADESADSMTGVEPDPVSRKRR